MLVVIDTNVLLVSISAKSKFHWLYQLIISDKIKMAVSNEIVEEYFEIIARKYNLDIAKSVIRTILELENVYFQTIFFNFHLIKNDVDDNKFVDCAVASNVDYLITNDKHFNVLKDIAFPKVNIKTIEEFKVIYNNVQSI